ncbi:MAG: hypothetical protein QM702_00065 [Rubrivivax sp.]
MAALSATPPERARKIVQAVLQRLQGGETQASLAIAIGASEATVNRLVNEHLDKLASVMAHLGLKVVPADYRCVDPEAYAFLTSTHERVMRQAPELIWDRED